MKLPPLMRRTAALSVLGFAAAARADIGGVVMNSETSQPVANVSVKLNGGATVVTDAQGRFVFSGVSLRLSAPQGRTPGPRWSLSFGVPALAGTHGFAMDGRLLAAVPGRNAYVTPALVWDGGSVKNGYSGKSGLAAAGKSASAGQATAEGPSRAGGAAGAAKAAASANLCALDAAGYKPVEYNCAEGAGNTLSITPETATTWFPRMPVVADDGWEPGDYQTAFPSAKSLRDLMDSLAAKKYKEVHSLLIIKGGKLVMEEYYQGNADTFDFEHGVKRMKNGDVWWSRTVKHYLASANKALTSMVVGLALAKAGKTVAAPIAQFLPAYQAQFTGGKAAITVEHALTMTMGFQWDEWTSNDLAAMWATPDIEAYVLGKTLAAAPGTSWIYNSAGPNLLLAAMQNAVGSDIAQFARDNLYTPLGIGDFVWGHQPNGLPEGSAKMFMRPRDLAKLAYMYLKGGAWEGKQVVPADWVAASLKLHLSAKPKNPNDYGYLWWVRHTSTPKGTAVDYVEMEGDGGNYAALFPGQDMVVVITGGNYGDSGTYDSQNVRMFSKFILPACGL